MNILILTMSFLMLTFNWRTINTQHNRSIQSIGKFFHQQNNTKHVNITKRFFDYDDNDEEEEEEENDDDKDDIKFFKMVDKVDDIENFSDFYKFDYFDQLFERFEKKFEIFQRKYKKVYKTRKEKLERLKVYSRNVKWIANHNKQQKAGRYLFSLIENEFSDLEYKEFISKYTGLSLKPIAKNKIKKTSTNKKAIIPKSIDWRKKNLVSAVLHQGNCGSCWAFATTGVLEGQLAKNHNIIYQLSKQQLLDCVQHDPSICQHGGNDVMAYDYMSLYGSMFHKVYPYIGQRNRMCHYNEEQVVSRPNFEIYTVTNEKDIQIKLSQVGPLYGVLHASPRFMYYDKGIFSDQNCKSKVNHAILFVGYGKDKNGKKYWIIKNSHGPKWGEGGFMRIERGVNMCRIGEYASYVLL